MQEFPQPTPVLRCAARVHDAGQCQLQADHHNEHIASTELVVFTWSASDTDDMHVYPADQLERWIRHAPWSAGFEPAA